MNDITALAQRMNEVDPRDEFEKLFPLPVFCIRCGTGYASTSFNGWAANTHKDRWEGWKAAMALMESRTVTVKLPLPRRKTEDDYVDDTFEPCDLAAIYNACRLECEVKFKKVLTAAGIQVIEGEG